MATVYIGQLKVNDGLDPFPRVNEALIMVKSQNSACVTK